MQYNKFQQLLNLGRGKMAQFQDPTSSILHVSVQKKIIPLTHFWALDI